MDLPILTGIIIKKMLSDYCKRKVMEHASDLFRLVFEIDGNEVTLCERRKTFARSKEWSKICIARFVFDRSTWKWTLYYANPSEPGAWTTYPEAKATSHFEKLLNAVDENKIGVF